MSKLKILFQLSGSIACFKSCSLISKFVKEGHEVQTVCTSAALNFIGPSTLEGLTGRPVITELFLPGHQMSHIHLTKWCDVTILCPASADTINSLANGLASDLIGALFLASDRSKPYWIAPAMNPTMYQHPATQGSLKTLKDWGIRILEPEDGLVACGDVGEGRLMDPEAIYERIITRPVKALRILLTSGATCENIDGVRYLSNVSSGATGAAIAEYFVNQGHWVSYLHGQQSRQPRTSSFSMAFDSTKDLDEKLYRLLQEPYDAVIHAAAVSDFSVERILTANTSQEPGRDFKLDSSAKDLTLKLKALPKLLSKIRTYAGHPDSMRVIAFKLTCNADSIAIKNAVDKLFQESQADFVVHNDLSEIDQSRNLHQARIFSKSQIIASTLTKNALAETLEKVLSEGRG